MIFPKKIFHDKILTVILPLISLLASCTGKSSDTEGAKDYSAAPKTISHAEKLIIEKDSGYTRVVIVNPWQGASRINQTYYLIKRGSAIPDMIDSSMVIFVPVEKIVCMSTTHIAMIAALGKVNTIAGVSGTDFPFSEELNMNIAKGIVEDVGYESNLNKELILKISPDLVMVYGIGSESNSYIGKIRELGIQVLFNADYLETDPLSKSEWIKLFGALYCMEDAADSIFNGEKTEYNRIKKYVSENVSKRPKVLLGLPFKDIWYISPGNSFISKLIEDAGGDYLWKNTVSAVSMPFGLENVYVNAINADYWLNIGTVKSSDEIRIVDERLTELPCFTKGNLYNNNKRVSPNGGNDYWESGALYPHIILNDIASILHPDLFAGYEQVYYRKINEN